MLDAVTRDFHLRQWEQPYRQTVHFAEFIRPLVQENEFIIDLGCGAGASTEYLAKQYMLSHFTGVDINPELLAEAISKAKFTTYEKANMLHLPTFMADGVVSLQTLHTLPKMEAPLNQICIKIRPRWMAFSTLLWNGEISCRIEVNEHIRPRVSFYNIYSMPRMVKFMQEREYKFHSCKSFLMDEPLKHEDRDIMGTRTYGKEMFSGPLWLPWWFIAFERI